MFNILWERINKYPCLQGQGCLSPLLFSICAEMMMVEAMEDVEKGVRVGGELLKDGKFANDQRQRYQNNDS